MQSIDKSEVCHENHDFEKTKSILRKLEIKWHSKIISDEIKYQSGLMNENNPLLAYNHSLTRINFHQNIITQLKLEEEEYEALNQHTSDTAGGSEDISNANALE